MKHNFLYISCPICGKQLIQLVESFDGTRHSYWCDKCGIDITIDENEEEE